MLHRMCYLSLLKQVGIFANFLETDRSTEIKDEKYTEFQNKSKKKMVNNVAKRGVAATKLN